MDDKSFPQPVRFENTSGQAVMVASVEEAVEFLSATAPADRGPRHRDALEICLKVLAGERSTAEAQEALSKALDEQDVAR